MTVNSINKFFNKRIVALTIVLLSIFALSLALYERHEIMCYDTDIWHIMNNGRYVVNNGFAMTDEPFTLHEGWNWVPQQWLTGVLYYLVYNTFSIPGMVVVSAILMSAMAFVIMKTMKYVSKDTMPLSTKVFATSVFLLFFNGIVAINPRFFDVMAVCISAAIVEYYDRHKKMLPTILMFSALSILFVNLHSVLFPIIFVYPGLYWLLHIRDKKARLDFIFIGLAMFASLFINPYSYHLVIYSIKSIIFLNHDSINRIGELSPTDFTQINIVPLLAVVLVGIPVLYFKNKVWFNDNKNCMKTLFLNEYFIFMIVSAIATGLHMRNVLLLMVTMVLYIAKYNKYFLNIFSVKTKALGNIGIALTTIIFVCFYSGISFSTDNAQTYNKNINEAMASIQKDAERENKDITNVKMYNFPNFGQYIEYNSGIKAYCDCRFEIYDERLNGKDNIMTEMFSFRSIKQFNESNKKYDFDYVLLSSDFDKALYCDFNDTNNQDRYKTELLSENEDFKVYALRYDE